MSSIEVEPISRSDDLVYMGKYSLLVCIFTELVMFSQLANTMYMVYAGTPPTIDHIFGCGVQNFTTNAEACQVIASCPEAKLELSRQFYGVCEQFKLYCDEHVEKFGTSLQMMGIMFGCLVFGHFSDVYGRKWPMVFCLFMCALFGYLSSCATNFSMFTMLRTILSFFNGGQSTISVVYMMENIPKRYRMCLSTLISFSPNVIILGVVAYIFQDWRTLSNSISVMLALPIFLTWWLHESPRWLMQKGNIEKAKDVLIKISEFDGRALPIDEHDLGDMLEMEHEQFRDSPKGSGTLQLFKDRKVAIGTLVIAFCFFSSTAINYGNMFNLGSLSGSIYLNSILIGLLRYSVSIACGALDYKFSWFNRKMSHFSCGVFSVIAVLTALIITFTGYDSSLRDVIRTCVMMSCAMTSQIIIVASVTSNELIPTSARAVSYSIAQLSSRLGIVIAPHLFALNNYFDNKYGYLPYVVLLVLALTDMIFFNTLIPETKNKPLEDHILKKKDTEMHLLKPQTGQ